MNRTLKRLAAALGAAAAAALLWAAWIEPRRLRVRRPRLWLPNWPAALDGLRVGVISDLHAGAPQVDGARVERVVDRVNAERPDLVALLGDYVDPAGALARRVEPEAVARALGRLRAPLGVLAVLGNHDWAHEGERMRGALLDAGIRVLENEAVQVDGLWVVGLADPTWRDPDIPRAFAAVPSDAAVLCLSHDPDLFPRIPARAALTLSGHTHGGQVDLPFVRQSWIPSRFGARFARGHVVERGRHLFVTAGVGTSRWPVRFRVEPEVVVVKLTEASPLRPHSSASRVQR